MAFQSCTTIAAIVLKDAHRFGIDVLADEILQSKIAERAGARSVSWDCDDLVFLDFDALRIAIHDIPATFETPNVICLAVGTVPGKTLPDHIVSASLTHGLVKRLTQSVEANAVLWHEDDRALSATIMDDFQEELGQMLGYLELQLQGPKTTEDTFKIEPEQQTPLQSVLCDQAAIDQFRAQLRKSGNTDEPISLPINVTIYILACTFFFMVPALGSALLSYIWLRDGVDKSASRS